MQKTASKWLKNKLQLSTNYKLKKNAWKKLKSIESQREGQEDEYVQLFIWKVWIEKTFFLADRAFISKIDRSDIYLKKLIDRTFI